MSESSELRNAFRVARQVGGVTGAISGPAQSTYSSASGAFASARDVIKKRFIIGSTFKGEVNVAGERVRLDVSGFDPKRYVDVVSFPEKYFPNEDINSDRVILAKGVFSKLFTPGGDFDEVNPIPPYDSQEFAILQEGLKNRFETLRYDIINERNQQGDTAAVRAKLDHIQKLVTLLDKLDDPEISRVDYSLDGRTVGTPVTINPEDNERFLGLLRTFAYLVLQGVYKVPGQDFGIDVDSLLNSIENRIITKEELDIYITAFQSTGQPIPSVITEVLSSTKTSPGLLEQMVADKVEGLYKLIVQGIRESLGSNTDESIKGAIAVLQKAFEDKVNELITSKTPYDQQIKDITLFLLEQNTAAIKAKTEADQKAEEATENYEESQANLDTLMAQYEELQKERDRIAGEKVAAVAALTKASQDVAGAREQAANLQAQLDAAAAACEAKLQPLKVRIESLTGELAAKAGAAAAAAAAREESAESCSATTAAIAALSTRLSAAEAAAAAEKVRADTAEANLAAAIAKLKPLEEANRELNGDIAGVRTELESLRSGAAPATAARDSRIAELEAELNAANQAKAAIESELATAQADVEAAAGAVAAAGAERDVAVSAKDAAIACQDDAVKMAAGLESQLAEINDLIEQKNFMLNEAGDDLARLREGFAEADAAQQKAEADLKASQSAAAAAALAAEHDKEEDTAKIRELEGRVTQAQADVVASRQAAADALAAQKAAEEAKRNAEDAKAAALATAAASLAQAERDVEAARAKAAAQLAAALNDAGSTGQSKDQRIKDLERQLSELANQSTNVTDLRRQIEQALGQAASSDAKYNKLLQALQAFSQSIANGTLTESDPVLRDNVSFLTIFEKIQGLKSGSGSDGQNTNRLYCLFTYYTNVFLHMFFIANNGELGYSLLSAMIDVMITRMDKSKPRAANLFSLLECLMPYVQSIESFLIKSSDTTPGGYYQFQFDREDDTKFKSRADTFMLYIYPILEQYGSKILQTVNPLFIKSVNPKLIGTTSSGYILFVNPVKTATYPNGILGNTPSILYLPDKDEMQSVLNTKVAYTYTFDTNTYSRITADEDTNLANLFNKRFLTYDMILGLFIVMSQKYIHAINGTISRYCPIPPAIMDPLSSIKQKWKKTTVLSLKGIDELPKQDRAHFKTDTDYYNALYDILVHPDEWSNMAIDKVRELFTSKYLTLQSSVRSRWEEFYPRQKADGTFYYGR